MGRRQRELLLCDLCVRHLITSFISVDSYLRNGDSDWLGDNNELMFIELLLCLRHFAKNFSCHISWLVTPYKVRTTFPCYRG